MSLDVSIDFLRKLDKLQPELKEILYSLFEELEKHRAKSVGKDEFNELKIIVKELSLAQKQTEKKIGELAEAQRQTEEEIRTLAKEIKDTRKEVGGLSTTIGYTLENEAYKKLPELIEKDSGISLKEGLKRKYVQDINGNDIEVNIFGHGKKDGKTVTIMGKCKSQLSKNKVNEFLRKKVKRLEEVYLDTFLVLVTHMTTSSEVEPYAKEKGIALYYSYDF